jgi:hypothetical protein
MEYNGVFIELLPQPQMTLYHISHKNIIKGEGLRRRGQMRWKEGNILKVNL